MRRGVGRKPPSRPISLATVRDVGAHLPMVQDPAGRGYFVRRNTRVGRQGGKVTQILSDAGVITEFFSTPDGTTTANPVTLGIKTETVPEQDSDLATGPA